MPRSIDVASIPVVLASTLACATVLAASFAGCASAPAERGTHAVASDASRRPLFEVEPFDRWRVVGGAARFEIEPGATPADEVLVGRGPIPRNGFLASPRAFGDFRLAVEVRIGSDGNPTGEKMNSGIQISSRDAGDRIVGLQIEIDPSPRAWSGGVYDEGGRAWLAPLEGNEAARAAFRLGGWNLYEIEAIGPRIRTRVNGVPAAEWLDGATDGLVAFQVHGGPACEVRFRGASIEELGRHAWARAGADGAISQGILGVRTRLSAGRSLVIADRKGATLAEAPAPVDAPADAPALAEILWSDGTFAVLIDGRRIGGGTLASPPVRATIASASDGGRSDADASVASAIEVLHRVEGAVPGARAH